MSTNKFRNCLLGSKNFCLPLLILTTMSTVTMAQKTLNQFEKDGYFIKELKLNPDPPEVGDQLVSVILHDRGGEPLIDAQVEIEAFMPQMGTMPRMSSKQKANHKGDGLYEVELEISMGGTWELPIRVKKNTEDNAIEFPFSITMDVEGALYKGDTGSSSKTNQEGVPTVYISQPRQQLIGVEIGKVTKQNLAREIRTVASLEVDESLVFDIVLKYSGYLEKLHADREGNFVVKGEPLFDIYSPELYSAETEYLQLFQNRNRSPASQTLFKNALEKLKIWGLSDEHLRRIEATGKATRLQTVHSPGSGYILKKNAVTGSFASNGQTIYQIADLSRLWILADIFEHEAMLVKVGDAVSLEFSYLPGTSIKGVLSYIYPTVDLQTRTIKVRIEIPNPHGELRPGMFADILIQSDPGERLVLPRRAVLFSGRHKYVFVALGNGYFEPREVLTGLQNGDWFEIKSGLKLGDAVSFSANFLISSEAQLRNAFPKWGKPPAQGPQAEAAYSGVLND